MGALHVVMFILGGLLAFSCLLTEDGERKLQRALEATWVHLDDVSEAAIGRHKRVARKVAATTNAILDALFGPRLFSARAVAISATLGLTTFLALGTFLISLLTYWEVDLTQSWKAEPGQVHMLVVMFRTVAGYAAWVMFAFAILPAIVKPFGVRIWGVLIGIFWIYTAGNCATMQEKTGETIASPYFFAFALGALCDVAFVALARKLFRATEKAESFLRILALTIGGLLLAVAVVALPLVPAFEVFPTAQHAAIALAMTSLTNLLDLAVMVLPLAVLILLVLHRIVWPVVKQPLYTVQRHEVFVHHKKKVLAAGIGLITLSCFGLPAWVEHALSHLG